MNADVKQKRFAVASTLKKGHIGHKKDIEILKICADIFISDYFPSFFYIFKKKEYGIYAEKTLSTT